MKQKIFFSEINTKLKESPGIYEIHTNSGTPLKVGIGTKLKSRLKQHGSSRQSGLKQKKEGSITEPSDLLSKSSILAKHLYFDRSICPELDLTKETNRQKFLNESCYILFEHTLDKQTARKKEMDAEATGIFRYIGKVVIR